MISVLIVDDHPLFCHGLSSVLSSCEDITIVGEVADGNSALVAATKLHPTVITMDLHLPDMLGSVTTEKILEEADRAEDGWSPQIIVLSTADDDESIVSAIEAGACGYLLKSAPPEEIIDAVRDAGEGRSVFASTVAVALAKQVRRSYPARHLSSRETDVIRFVAQGLTNLEIAQNMILEPSTIKTHIEHIFKILNVSNRTQAVARAREYGVIR